MRAVVIVNDNKYFDHIKNNLSQTADTDVHNRSKNKTLELMDLSRNAIVVDYYQSKIHLSFPESRENL